MHQENVWGAGRVTSSMIESIAIADLALFKEVFQHLPIWEVIKIIDASLENSKYIIAINESTGQHLNREIDIVVYRPIELSLQPFN